MPLFGATRPTHSQRAPPSEAADPPSAVTATGVGAMAAGGTTAVRTYPARCNSPSLNAETAMPSAARGANKASSWMARSWWRASGLFHAA